MQTGIEQITKERNDQIEKYGYTGEWQAKNPEFYACGQLIKAAKELLEENNPFLCEPENWDEAWFLKLLNKPYKERLAIAGALIAAELDRLNYE